MQCMDSSLLRTDFHTLTNSIRASAIADVPCTSLPTNVRYGDPAAKHFPSLKRCDRWKLPYTVQQSLTTGTVVMAKVKFGRSYFYTDPVVCLHTTSNGGAAHDKWN